MGHVGLTPQSISVLGGFRPAAQSGAWLRLVAGVCDLTWPLRLLVCWPQLACAQASQSPSRACPDPPSPGLPTRLPSPAASEALRVIKEAKALEAAGCFSVVLECVPALVAAAVTRELSIPTVGIGAGGGTSGQARRGGRGGACRLAVCGGQPGLRAVHSPACPPPPRPRLDQLSTLLCTLAQVLVYHDLLGMMQHPHHAKVTPKFCKQYAAVGAVIQEVRGWRRRPAACCAALRASGPACGLRHTCTLTHPSTRPPAAHLLQALAAYHEDVVERRFPSEAFSPYRIPPREASQLMQELQREGLGRAAEAVAEAAASEAA